MKSPHAGEEKAAQGGSLPIAEPTNSQPGSSFTAGAVAPRAYSNADDTAGGHEASPFMLLNDLTPVMSMALETNAKTIAIQSTT